MPGLTPRFESEPWQRDRLAAVAKETTLEQIDSAIEERDRLFREFRVDASAERNFEIAVRPIGKKSDKKTAPTPEVSVLLKKKEGDEFLDLQSYLPPGYTLAKSHSFYFSPSRKRVRLSQDRIQDRGFLLSAFHEIGHARQHAEGRLPDTPMTRKEKLQQSLAKKWRYVKEFIEELGDLHAVEQKMRSLPYDEFLPLSFLERECEDEAPYERDAWVFALRELRKLERRGYTIFAGFKNVKEIQAYIAYCLWSYELDRAGILAETDKLGEDYQQTYLKK